MTKKVISIISPCFNEEDSIVDCYKKIKRLFDVNLVQYRREHIFCDNGSSDQTVSILKDIAKNDKDVKIILNSRNFGILKNTYNGVMSSSGDAILLFMPVDLQDPPELLPSFIEKWESGFEIVYGIRSVREESYITNVLRKIYYRILSRISYIEYPIDAGDFQLVDRKVVNAMKNIDDAQPFMRVMTFETGFKSIGISYTWRKRKIGISHNKLMQMFEQGLNGIISFSIFPIRFALILGILVSICSLFYALYVFIISILGYVNPAPGISIIIIALFFFGGVQLFFLGVLGEYILAIYNQVRRKPLVVERERINF